MGKKEHNKKSLRDTIIGSSMDEKMGDLREFMEEGDVSDDDAIKGEEEKGEEEGPWFSIGMTKAEKVEVRKPW